MTPKAYSGLKNALSRHKGALHRVLGVPEGEKIPADKMAQAANSRNPHMRKMAALAKTAKGFKHAVAALALIGLMAGAAHADGPFGGCKTVVTNAVNTGSDISVDNTSGGVKVMAAASTLTGPRCSAYIKNTGTAGMRCRSKGDGAPTSSVGADVQPGEKIVMTFEGAEEWECIRETSTTTTANVVESRQ